MNTALTIAGTDPSGGAGMLIWKPFTALKVYGIVHSGVGPRIPVAFG